MASGAICINQPRFVNHVLCYGIMYGFIEEECRGCPEKHRCDELTQINNKEKNKKQKPKKRKEQEPQEKVLFVKGVK